MAALKQLLEICFSPIGIITLLCTVGFVVCIFRRQSRLGRRMLLTGVGMYLFSLFTPLAEVLIAGLERPYPPLLRPDSAAGIQMIVVLSGYGENHPSLPATSKLADDTVCRMAEGIRLYRNLPGSRLIFSGGILRKNDPPVARLMADYAEELGVPRQDIVVEGQSLTTYENLVEVQRIIGGSRFILVTSACDLRRALAVAHRLGMQPLVAPACIWEAQYFPPGLSWSAWFWKVVEKFGHPSSQRLGYLQRAYHEYVGYAWYWLLGRV